MQNDNNNNSFDLLKKEVMSLFDDQLLNNQVSVEDQQEELKYQSKMIGGERFFFVVDLVNFEIVDHGGINRWLGFSEFTYKKYWTLLHPGTQKPAMMFSRQLYLSLCSGRYLLNFMVQRFSNVIAIKHRDGHYLLAKKISSVFQYDERNRLTSYLNEFTIIGPYNGEAMNPQIYNNMGPEDRGKEIMEEVIKRFLDLKIFSQQEFKLARTIVEFPMYTQTAIAKEIKIGLNSVGTYSRRFLTKAREYFGIDFASTLEAAGYLRKNGLI